MKVLSVCGISQSGKTTTIENIIRELSKRGYRVGSVKEIHFETFAIDPDPKSNTRRHRAAGAKLVSARGLNETDILYDEKLPMHRILEFYDRDYDWVVLEGVSDIPVPTIITAHNEDGLNNIWSDMVFCVSGRVAAQIKEYRDVPAIDATTDIKKLVDLIELKVYKRLPGFDPKCCMACGMTCDELGTAILRGKKKRADCVADKGVELIINGRRIDMVPFVQKILSNTIHGVVSELEGYVDGCEIEIRI